jgi:hypothetical protein
VKKLAEEFRAMGVHCLGQSPIAGDAAIVMTHQNVGAVSGAVVNAGRLGDDQAAAASGARFVIGDEAVADPPVVGHDRVVTGRDDAVLQRYVANPERREEMREA